jgi:hypothetical protein
VRDKKIAENVKKKNSYPFCPTKNNSYSNIFAEKSVFQQFFLRDAPDNNFSGHPAGRISGQSKSRIPDIWCRPETERIFNSTFKRLVKF